MKLKSLSARLSLWYAAVCLVVCAALAAGTFLWLRGLLLSTVSATLDRRAAQISALLQVHQNDSSATVVINEIRASYASEQNNRFIRISLADGKALYVSGQPADGTFDPAQIPFERSSTSQPEIHRLAAQNMLIAKRSVLVNGVTYVVEDGTSLEPTEKVLNAFLTMLLLVSPAVLIIAVTGGVILVRRSLKPVREITAAAQDITYRNPRSRLPVVETGDEIENLSRVLNQMLARLEAAFVVSQRFGALASHELRTPLTIIMGDLEALLRDHNLPASASERIASVFEEAERLAKIVEGIFAIARLEAGEARMNSTEFDLSALVETTADQMSLMAEEKNLLLQCKTNTSLEIVADRSRIKQVIVNLLDNAIKYSRSGGEVFLRIYRENDEAVLEVLDNGPGIPTEAMDHIFESFYRADSELTRQVEGAGLGLSIVKSICVAHRGSVEAANRPAGGCAITVRLPLK